MTKTLVERVYFAVPTNYTQGEEFESFAEALQAARATIVCFTYPGQGQDNEDLVRYSRAFVDLRVTEPVQEREGHAVRSGSDHVAKRWEVFNDGTIREMVTVSEAVST